MTGSLGLLHLLLLFTSASPLHETRARGWLAPGQAQDWGACSRTPLLLSLPCLSLQAGLWAVPLCPVPPHLGISLPPSLLFPQRRAPSHPLPGTEDKNTQWKNTWLQVKH